MEIGTRRSRAPSHWQQHQRGAGRREQGPEERPLPAGASTSTGGVFAQLSTVLTQFVVALLVAIGLVFLILVATFRSLTGRTHLLWRATDRHSDAELKAGFVAAVGWDPSDEGTDWRFFRLMPVRF